jgi:subtilisin family serine protease
MKRKIAIIALLMTVTVFSAGAQWRLPASVQRFMEERKYRNCPFAGELSRLVPARVIDGEELVDAFIAISNDGVIRQLKAAGVRVHSLFDEFVTAQIPVDVLEKVSRMPGVNDVEIARKVQLCTDSTLSVTRTGMVLNGTAYGLPAAYDGSGVIVGIIDRGFDFQHRAFRRSDDPSRTRIVRIYNTLNNSGHPARNEAGSYLPGSVFMGNEIYSLKYDYSGTHGTHTASIAAGTHVNGYGGMAPGADIVLCAVSVLDGGLSTVEIANCVRYIHAYADSVNMPCVMSLSVSTPDGTHDGNDYLSKAIAKVVGPGRIFVISAGNSGAAPMYAHKLVTRANPINLLFKTKTSADMDSSYYYKGFLADMWMRKERTRLQYKFHILDQYTGHIVWESEELSSNSVFRPSDIQNYYKYDSSVDTTGHIKGFVTTSSDGKKYNVNVSIYNLVSKSYSVVNGQKVSRYAIGISIYPRLETQSDLDAWANHGTSRFGSFKKPVITLAGDTINNFYTPSNNDCTIGTYAVNDSIISVGAFAARNSYYSMQMNRVMYDWAYVVGDICSFSSFQIPGTGPTGKALPTVCAPGVDVVAAASRYSYLADHVNTVMKTADGSYWGVMTGTSMSSPTVAGIIALWLQANPNLSPSQVKDIIAQTAIRDYYTTGSHRHAFGPNGKIDAFAGIKEVLKGVAPPPMLGDVNLDGKLDIADLTALVAYLIGNPVEGQIDLVNADVDRDGKLTIADVTSLIWILLGKTA